MADLFNWPKFRLTRLVFFRARPVNRGTHEHPRMSKGYLQPLVFLLFFFGVTFVHANLCTHMLASIIQDGGNPFPVTRLPALTSVTDSSRHSLLLTSLLRLWSRQVYIIHRSITGFLVVQEATCTHAHEYRLLGASCFYYFILVSHLCMQIYASPPIFIIIQRRNYKEKPFFFLSSQGESNSRPLNLKTNALSTGLRQ